MLKIFCFYFILSIISAHIALAQLIEKNEGKASYYGTKFHGKLTANGEIFNMNELTAAHPKLPFNTMVRVINKQNNKSVIVRINDRGPFTKNRIIDLSKAAAEKLGMVERGTATVVLEVLEPYNLENISQEF